MLRVGTKERWMTKRYNFTKLSSFPWNSCCKNNYFFCIFWRTPLEIDCSCWFLISNLSGEHWSNKYLPIIFQKSYYFPHKIFSEPLSWKNVFLVTLSSITNYSFVFIIWPFYFLTSFIVNYAHFIFLLPDSGLHPGTFLGNPPLPFLNTKMFLVCSWKKKCEFINICM